MELLNVGVNPNESHSRNDIEFFQFEKVHDKGSYLDHKQVKPIFKGTKNLVKIDPKRKICTEVIDKLVKQRMN
eukprot:CAMPEP_0116958720 /NCGR_PEP_ID=MMETSP0467-20121206/44820_1 /TAXON_ID=283647 /ORGANISM="Mesodinium pulex, Strain SPMC105" /LENGTH=72 /DNA_ID=CAMNT_0004645885 /DNA_START=187 /DNA_END=402 /DNA_ORIENTATION=+